MQMLAGRVVSEQSFGLKTFVFRDSKFLSLHLDERDIRIIASFINLALVVKH